MHRSRPTQLGRYHTRISGAQRASTDARVATDRGATAMANQIKSGGGITSNQVVQKHESTSAKPKSHGASPGGADQLGAKVATKSAYEPLYSGSGYPSKLGN